jgi:hypothetical protein
MLKVCQAKKFSAHEPSAYKPSPELQLAIPCEVIDLQNIMPANRAGMILMTSRRQQRYDYSCVTRSPLRCTTILTPDCISGVAPNLRRSWATSPRYLRGI